MHFTDEVRNAGLVRSGTASAAFTPTRCEIRSRHSGDQDLTLGIIQVRRAEARSRRVPRVGAGFASTLEEPPEPAGAVLPMTRQPTRPTAVASVASPSATMV